MWDKKKRAKIKELRETTEAASNQLESQKPDVNALAYWLSKRKDQNGFGLDFEYTLRPRGAK